MVREEGGDGGGPPFAGGASLSECGISGAWLLGTPLLVGFGIVSFGAPIFPPRVAFAVVLLPESSIISKLKMSESKRCGWFVSGARDAVAVWLVFCRVGWAGLF